MSTPVEKVASENAVSPSKEKHMPTGTLSNPALAQQLLDAFDALSGVHPGFRPAHAKGLMCSGTFTPSPEAAKLTRAPHASRPSTPVTVRDNVGMLVFTQMEADGHATRA